MAIKSFAERLKNFGEDLRRDWSNLRPSKWGTFEPNWPNFRYPILRRLNGIGAGINNRPGLRKAINGFNKWTWIFQAPIRLAWTLTKTAIRSLAFIVEASVMNGLADGFKEMRKSGGLNKNFFIGLVKFVLGLGGIGGLIYGGIVVGPAIGLGGAIVYAGATAATSLATGSGAAIAATSAIGGGAILASKLSADTLVNIGKPVDLQAKGVREVGQAESKIAREGEAGEKERKPSREQEVKIRQAASRERTQSIGEEDDESSFAASEARSAARRVAGVKAATSAAQTAGDSVSSRQPPAQVRSAQPDRMAASQPVRGGISPKSDAEKTIITAAPVQIKVPGLDGTKPLTSKTPLIFGGGVSDQRMRMDLSQNGNLRVWAANKDDLIHFLKNQTDQIIDKVQRINIGPVDDYSNSPPHSTEEVAAIKAEVKKLKWDGTQMQRSAVPLQPNRADQQAGAAPIAPVQPAETPKASQAAPKQTGSIIIAPSDRESYDQSSADMVASRANVGRTSLASADQEYIGSIFVLGGHKDTASIVETVRENELYKKGLLTINAKDESEAIALVKDLSSDSLRRIEVLNIGEKTYDIDEDEEKIYIEKFVRKVKEFQARASASAQSAAAAPAVPVPPPIAPPMAAAPAAQPAARQPVSPRAVRVGQVEQPQPKEISVGPPVGASLVKPMAKAGQPVSQVASAKPLPSGVIPSDRIAAPATPPSIVLVSIRDIGRNEFDKINRKAGRIATRKFIKHIVEAPVRMEDEDLMKEPEKFYSTSIMTIIDGKNVKQAGKAVSVFIKEDSSYRDYGLISINATTQEEAENLLRQLDLVYLNRVKEINIGNSQHKNTYEKGNFVHDLLTKIGNEISAASRKKPSGRSVQEDVPKPKAAGLSAAAPARAATPASTPPPAQTQARAAQPVAPAIPAASVAQPAAQLQLSPQAAEIVARAQARQNAPKPFSILLESDFPKDDQWLKQTRFQRFDDFSRKVGRPPYQVNVYDEFGDMGKFRLNLSSSHPEEQRNASIEFTNKFFQYTNTTGSSTFAENVLTLKITGGEERQVGSFLAKLNGETLNKIGKIFFNDKEYTKEQVEKAKSDAKFYRDEMEKIRRQQEEDKIRREEQEPKSSQGFDKRLQAANGGFQQAQRGGAPDQPGSSVLSGGLNVIHKERDKEQSLADRAPSPPRQPEQPAPGPAESAPPVKPPESRSPKGP